MHKRGEKANWGYPRLVGSIEAVQTIIEKSCGYKVVWICTTNVISLSFFIGKMKTKRLLKRLNLAQTRSKQHLPYSTCFLLAVNNIESLSLWKTKILELKNIFKNITQKTMLKVHNCRWVHTQLSVCGLCYEFKKKIYLETHLISPFCLHGFACSKAPRNSVEQGR